MNCEDVRAEILLDERSDATERHLLDCQACTAYVARLARLDALLMPELVVEPSLELQASLLQIAKSAAVQPVPAWKWALGLVWSPTAAALTVAGITTGLALWQIMGWLTAFAAMLGNVPYALEVLANSPAVSVLAESSADFAQIGVWALLGVGLWLFSDVSPLRQTRPRAPRIV